MTATSAGLVNLALGLIAAVVLLSIVLGVVDLLRLPGWAWRAAGEPKLLSLALVVLLPGVGLAIYVFGARPKVLDVASAGRAANLPFERFGDREALATESTRSIQALALPTTLGSFGERRPTRAVPAGGHTDPAPAHGGFFDDPDLVTVAGPTTTLLEPEAVPRSTATATEEPAIRVPGSLGRPYNPRQRTSLEEGGPAAGGSPVPAARVAGPSFAASAPATRFGQRTAAHAPTAQAVAAQLAAAPFATPGTPEIFRPRPEEVAPLAVAASGAVATLAPAATMAARWMPDPTGRHQYRYWDGGCWTENVYDSGVESRDAVTD